MGYPNSQREDGSNGKPDDGHSDLFFVVEEGGDVTDIKDMMTRTCAISFAKYRRKTAPRPRQRVIRERFESQEQMDANAGFRGEVE